MNGFGQLLSNVTPANLLTFPDGNGFLVQTLDGRNVGFNSNGELTYSKDTGDDQRWQKGDKCMVSVNSYQGNIKYGFLEWY